MNKITNYAFYAVLSTLILTGCQNESVDSDSEVLDSVLTPIGVEGEIIAGSYIVVFDSKEIEPTSGKLTRTVFKDRATKSKMSKNLEKEAVNKIAAKMSSGKFDDSKISNYFTSQFTGISVKGVSDKELIELSNIEGVKEIYYDVLVPNPMDSVIAEKVQDASSGKMAQSTPCGISRAGGFVNSSNSDSLIWIIDTGIDLDHPDLNVVTDSRYARSYVGGSANDCNGHGTHVAGIAAAINNNIGVVGVSAGASVVPVRVFGCRGGASTANILAAINHVGQNDLPGDSVNLSLGVFFGNGCSTNSPYRSALQSLGNSGTHIAIAAGNSTADTGLYAPGCINGNRVYTVASMTCDYRFSSFSNYNRSAVDVIATGSNVSSTWLNGGYRTISGTSMASPHVAGILHARNGAPLSAGNLTNRGQSYPVAIVKR